MDHHQGDRQAAREIEKHSKHGAQEGCSLYPAPRHARHVLAQMPYGPIEQSVRGWLQPLRTGLEQGSPGRLGSGHAPGCTGVLPFVSVCAHGAAVQSPLPSAAEWACPHPAGSPPCTGNALARALQRPPTFWYMPSMASEKWAIRLVRLSLSVGVMKVFSIVQGVSVRCTARGTA